MMTSTVIATTYMHDFLSMIINTNFIKIIYLRWYLMYIKSLMAKLVIKGCSLKNLTDHILFSLYLGAGTSDHQNLCVYPR